MKAQRVIIMGCGRVGAALANMMADEHWDVTILDQYTSAFTRLGSRFSGTKVIGDGLDGDVLRRVGIEDAACFVAVTNGDNRNIMAAQIAKHTFGVPRVICRIYDPIRQQVYQELGLESVCPTVIGAKLIHDAILVPEQSAVSAALSIAEGRSVPPTPLPHDESTTGVRGVINSPAGMLGTGGASRAPSGDGDERREGRRNGVRGANGQ
ncbi:MAG TPA: TrkA family potassium uptake protein [Ktedonobacterales bacterium]